MAQLDPPLPLCRRWAFLRHAYYLILPYLLRVRSIASVPQVWRPSLDDVQRISTGDAAKHRGTGSRAVPHRLNAEERKAYDLAKQVGLLRHC